MRETLAMVLISPQCPPASVPWAMPSDGSLPQASFAARDHSTSASAAAPRVEHDPWSPAGMQARGEPLRDGGGRGLAAEQEHLRRRRGD